MKNLKKEDAISELNNLISEIDSLKNVKIYSSEHTRWILNANALLISINSLT